MMSIYSLVISCLTVNYKWQKSKPLLCFACSFTIVEFFSFICLWRFTFNCLSIYLFSLVSRLLSTVSRQPLLEATGLVQTSWFYVCTGWRQDVYVCMSVLICYHFYGHFKAFEVLGLFRNIGCNLFSKSWEQSLSYALPISFFIEVHLCSGAQKTAYSYVMNSSV